MDKFTVIVELLFMVLLSGCVLIGEEQMNENRKSIEYPYMNGYCEKCKNHYLLDGDESRCNVIALLRNSAMCAQVKSCVKYKECK